jgi:hypothetical protein
LDKEIVLQNCFEAGRCAYGFVDNRQADRLRFPRFFYPSFARKPGKCSPLPTTPQAPTTNQEVLYLIFKKKRKGKGKWKGSYQTTSHCREKHGPLLVVSYAVSSDTRMTQDGTRENS